MFTIDYNPHIKNFLDENKIEFLEIGFIFVDDSDEETEEKIQDYLEENKFEYIRD